MIWRIVIMADRIVLNTISYHGHGAIENIVPELTARGYKKADAARIGMYLHGLAGDLAIKDLGKESLIASDLIDYLPKAFLRIEE